MEESPIWRRRCGSVGGEDWAALVRMGVCCVCVVCVAERERKRKKRRGCRRKNTKVEGRWELGFVWVEAGAPSDRVQGRRSA